MKSLKTYFNYLYINKYEYCVNVYMYMQNLFHWFIPPKVYYIIYCMVINSDCNRNSKNNLTLVLLV